MTLALSECWGQSFLPTTKGGEVVHHTYYTLCYEEEYEGALWVFYLLTSEMVNGSAERKNNFKADPKVTTGSASPKDYTKSGYDRGHLASAADMKISQVAMDESFLMSNMSPQHPSLNRGRWKTLEEWVREWVTTNGELYVAVGAIYNELLGTIGTNSVAVPASYYKILYSAEKEEMIAFIMENKKLDGDIKEYIVSVDRVEELVGIDFFAELDDELENRLESKSNKDKWGF